MLKSLLLSSVLLIALSAAVTAQDATEAESAEAYAKKWQAMLKAEEFEKQISIIRAEIEALITRSATEKGLREIALVAAASGYALLGDEEAQKRAEDLLLAEFPANAVVRRILFSRAIEEQDSFRKADLIEEFISRYPKSADWMLYSILFRARAKQPGATAQKLLSIGEAWIKSAGQIAYPMVEAEASLAIVLAERKDELDRAKFWAGEAVKVADGLVGDSPLIAQVQAGARESHIALLKEKAHAALGFVLLRRGELAEARKELEPALKAVTAQVERSGIFTWRDVDLREIGVRPRVLWLAELFEGEGRYDSAQKYLLAGLCDDEQINAGIRARSAALATKLGQTVATAEKLVAEAERRFLSTTTRTAALESEEKKKAVTGRIGMPAPDYQFLTMDRRAVRLSELKGKVVVLNFWATWCGPCVKEMPSFQKVADKYSGNGDVLFFAVSVDENRALIRPFIEKNKYRLSFGYDSGGSNVFDVASIPVVFMIDRNGVIQYRDVGFGGAAERYVERMAWRVDELLKPEQPR